MSLSSLISGSFKDFFKEIVPTKKDFKTVSGKAAFSKADYIEYAEYKLENPHNSAIVGTAFDYLARWIIAKNVNVGKENSYLNLVAENGIQCCEVVAKRNKACSIQKKYDNGIKCVKRFVNGSNNKVEIIKIAIFFAKLEQVFRRLIPLPLIDIDKLLQVEEEIYEDLIALINVFQIKMIDSGIVTGNSIVVYNPTFGGASYLCGGADADVYIDGTLYDFKCTKKVGYTWNEAAQILGYYLLDKLSKNCNDPNNMLEDYKINRIAFYRARFGEIEYYDICEENYAEAIEKFAELLGKEEYQEYFQKSKRMEEEEQKKREEEERKRLALEEDYSNVERIHKKLIKYTNCGFLFEDLKKYTDKEERLRKMKIDIIVCYNSRIPDKIDGEKLKKKMEISKIGLNLLCKKMGKSQSTIRNWVEEKNNPTAGALIDLTEIFSCSINELIKGKEHSLSMNRRKNNKKK